MKKRDKVIISVLAIVFSILSSSIGFGFVGSTDLSFTEKFLFNFIFMMTPLSVIWTVIALFRKDN